jgi:hypothetical protein
MSEVKTFECEQCHGQVELRQAGAVPQCCGQPMTAVDEPLGQCTLSNTSEHSRLDDMGEPCDDGRAG